MNWIYYVEGYRIAAEKLIDDVLNTQNERDTLIYPFVFLYRHYLEIQLKEIIQIGSDLLNENAEIITSHDLFQLWLSAKIIINNIWHPDTDNNDMDKMEGIIKAISMIDTKSDSFRYPYDTKRKPNLKGISVINLREFKESITPLVQFLDGVSLAISDYQNKKKELPSQL